MAEFFASAFWTGFLWPLIIMVAESVLLLVVLLIAIAYILLADRKIWAAVQIRRGPNVVGPFGLFQSFADLLKFVLKEPIIPAGANKGVFLLAPLVSCVLALAAWAVIPTNLGWVIADINVGVLYIFAISSLAIYGIIMAGWSSNSKYPFLAALRSAAQMVSYEVSIGFVIITVLLCAGSLNLSAIVEAQNTQIRPDCSAGTGCRCFRCSWCFMSRHWRRPTVRRSIWSKRNPSWSRASWSNTARRRICCSCLANMSRSPRCARWPRLCFSAAGSRRSPLPRSPGCPGIIWFALKLFFMFFLFAMAKAIVPRYRYDQLMRLGWKVFLPLSLAMVVIVAGVLQFAGIAPK